MTDRTEVNLWLAAADADELVCQCGARKEIGHLSVKAKATSIVAFVRKHIGTCEINGAFRASPSPETERTEP